MVIKFTFDSENFSKLFSSFFAYHFAGTTTIVQDEPSRIMQRRMPQVETTLPSTTTQQLSNEGQFYVQIWKFSFTLESCRN